MENNFGLILLNLTRANKEKFLGLLRRNGVLVGSDVSAEFLTNLVLRAMQKSETFKKEVVSLMAILLGDDDSSFSNTSGFANPLAGTNPLDTFSFNTSLPSTPMVTNTQVKETKKFEDTTVGKLTDKLFGIANLYLTKEDLAVRAKEADAGVKISQDKVMLETQKDDDAPKSKVGLYVGLGLGGLAIVGVVVYLISKKK